MTDGFIWALLVGAVGRFIGLLDSHVSYLIVSLKYNNCWSATLLLHLSVCNILILLF